jgi:hypothetical protein
MDIEKFWKSVERFKLIIELVTSLFVVVPIVYAIIAQGLTATMPAWAVLFIAFSAIVLGYLIGQNSIKRVMPSSKPKEPSNPLLLQTIDFNYQDSPAKHNWIINSPEEGQPDITHVADGFWGNTIKIQASVNCTMDISITEPIAQIGKRIEFVAKVEKGYGLYSLGNYISKDGAIPKNIWFNYKIGDGEPVSVNPDKSEWHVFMEPELLEGNWQRFNINLQDVMNRSVAKEGWSLKRLTRFRLRGNMQIAQIKVFR